MLFRGSASSYTMVPNFIPLVNKIYWLSGGTFSGRVDPRVEPVGVLLTENFNMNYRSVNDIKDRGPCLVPGHPKEHDLELECWTTMRRFLFTKTFQQYLEAVRNKG